ncbi:ATP-dependent helicase BRM [Tanacetum coccineum]
MRTKSISSKSKKSPTPEDLQSKRATFSSILKDSKFHEQVANATNGVAGDGFTYATVLTCEIGSKGRKSVAAGTNAMDLRPVFVAMCNATSATQAQMAEQQIVRLLDDCFIQVLFVLFYCGTEISGSIHQKASRISLGDSGCTDQRNRGVAKHHEKMLREFSNNRKDDDGSARMEALKFIIRTKSLDVMVVFSSLRNSEVGQEQSSLLNKPVQKFGRSGSLRSLRILRSKSISSKSKKSPTPEDLHSKRATFSSILKDSKFHQVKPQVGIKESKDVLPVEKLCFTYATVLTCEIGSKGRKSVATGMNAMDLRQEKQGASGTNNKLQALKLTKEFTQQDMLMLIEQMRDNELKRIIKRGYKLILKKWKLRKESCHDYWASIIILGALEDALSGGKEGKLHLRALLKRVFMPCDMYFRYTRHKGGTTDFKVLPRMLYQKLLESHWAIRGARTIAKYHEKMLREFSKNRKDDDRSARIEALKNNNVERYRHILLDQQMSVPSEAAERYEVLSSFLSQTEDYLPKLGSRITAAKNQQEVAEAANAASFAARAQGLSEEEVRAAASCAGEEVVTIRNRFSEMNAPQDGSSVSKCYTLAHAVNEKVMALIAYLMEYKSNYRPHLIIVPNAVLVNWKSELHNWLPNVSCIYCVGNNDQQAKLFS